MVQMANLLLIYFLNKPLYRFPYWLTGLLIRFPPTVSMRSLFKAHVVLQVRVPSAVQLPYNVPQKAAKDGLDAWSPQCLVTWKKLLTPDFILAYPWPLQPFGE